MSSKSNTDTMEESDSAPEQPPEPMQGIPNVEDLEDGEKVDYAPVAIPQEREIVQHRSYYTHKVACLTFTVLAIVAIAGGVCGSGHCGSNDNEPAPVTFAPTTYRTSLSMQFEAKLKEAFGDDYLDDNQAHVEERWKALEWILNDDPMQLSSDANNFIQRYVLRVFYHLTSQAAPWMNCDRAEAETCIFEEFMGEGRGYSWFTDISECFWAGVACQGEDKTNVTSIRLFKNGLNGLLPHEVSELRQLTDLTLTGHNLTGKIPSQLGLLSRLTSLDLGNNQLTGEFPAYLFEPLQESLQALHLDGNLFTGTIPTEVGLFNATHLKFQNNPGLNGTLPNEMYGLSNMVLSWLTGTGIHGTIQTQIGRMSALRGLYATNSLISGHVPSQLGLLQNFGGIGIERSKIGGTIPEELYFMPSLRYMQFDNCNFSGTISTNLGRLANLTDLKLANNNFSGAIPTEIAVLTKLIRFSMQGNDFQGTFPESLCAMSLSENFGYGHLEADCLPDEETEVPAMECECCTHCCSKRTGICRDV